MNRIALLTAVAFSAYSCGGEVEGGPREGGAGADSLLGAVYVDPLAGIDSAGRGASADMPVKTIQYALGAPNRRSVVLALGVYSTASGESFPITVPAGVKIVGKDFLRNGTQNFAKVVGCGTRAGTDMPAAIVLQGGTFEFAGASCPQGAGVLMLGTSGNSLINNTILYESTFGAVLRGKGSVIYSLAYDNTSSGLYIQSGASVTLFDNVIARNRIGLTMEDGAQAEFVNAAGTTGMALLENRECDFRYFGRDLLFLQGTVWDEPEDAFGVVRACSAGANVSVEGPGSVFIGALTHSTTPMFEVGRRVNLVSPVDGQLAASTSPSLQWSPDGSALAAVAIFAKMPVVGTGGIENTGDIVWFWHSGLGGGVSGRMTYAGGRHPIAGDLTRLEAPTPLARGRTYYWAAWEWSSVDGRVSASSPIGVFRTRP